ncbi:MAG: tRNA pseudouridine(55) synthase TruB, partial [Oscillospiraceae bacterium]
MNGIIIVDKPAGYTSFDVIAKLRGILGERRLGHGGTLDPMATGVLPVFAGNATKAVDFLPDETKRYTATVRLGILTDTGDITGTITEKSDKNCTLQELECALCSFVGAQKQVPPMYSAIKKDGKRLYELARKGKTVEREPRNIEITELRLVDFDESVREFAIDVLCSKGTYIRTLAEDIAASMGLVAALCALRRTMSA